jgi:hypothetical protein
MASNSTDHAWLASHMKRFAVGSRLLLTVMIAIGVVACAPAQYVTPSRSAAAPDLHAMARQIAQGVGTVRAVSLPAGSARGTAFVLEENHRSILGQVEIAVMLERLKSHGLRSIGLEGLPRGKRLDVAWYGRRAHEPRSDEEIVLQLLADGEISAPEATALSDSGIEVYGAERAELYAKELGVRGWPEATYLLRLAEAAIPPAEAAALASQSSRASAEQRAARVLEADPWVKTQWEDMMRLDTPVEEVASRLRLVQQRAQWRKVDIEAGLKRDFEHLLDFFETAARRSETIAAEVGAHLRHENTGIGALVVGAAHGRGVEGALKQGGFAVVSLRPVSFSREAGMLNASGFERKRRGLWPGTSGHSLACVLNTQRKPPPIINSISARGYFWAYAAVRSLARTVRDHKDIEAAKRALPQSPHASLEKLRVEGKDVVLNLSLTDTSGRRTSVWARAHALGGTDADLASTKTREEKLLLLLSRYRAELQGSVPDQEPGAVRLGRDVRAVFGRNEQDVHAEAFKAVASSDKC